MLDRLAVLPVVEAGRSRIARLPRGRGRVSKPQTPLAAPTVHLAKVDAPLAKPVPTASQ